MTRFWRSAFESTEAAEAQDLAVNSDVTNRNLVIVYGSGASRGSGYQVEVREQQKGKHFAAAIKPPTDKDFFLEINDGFLKDEYKALCLFIDLYFRQKSILGLEEAWTALDLNAKHILLDTYDWRKETDTYLATAKQYPLMETTGYYAPPGTLDTSPQYGTTKFLGDCGRDFIRLIFNVFSPYKFVGENCFKSLHEMAAPRLLGYLTFNYDCYLEDSLPQGQFKYVADNADARSLENLISGAIPIVKLHGSLSWLHKYGAPRIEFKAPPYEKSVQIEPRYEHDASWYEPAIIPPTFYKQQINDDSRKGNPLTETILQQWRAALTMLRQAQKIIFVGYSFPTSDFHSKRLFQLSVMGRREPFNILDCVGPDVDKSNKEKFLKSIFGDGAEVAFVQTFDSLVSSGELRQLLDV